jgi:hypothetical protein
MKPLVVAFALLCSITLLPAAQAQETDDKALDAEIAAYVIPIQNRFVQIELNKDIIERTLAVLPSYLKHQTNYADKMLAVSRSDKSMWDKAVAFNAINKTGAAEIDAVCKSGGFADRADFDRALSSLIIVVKPEELRPMARMVLQSLKAYQEGNLGWLAGATVKFGLERTLSLAQQQPLPANVALITPMIVELRKRLDALKP